MKLSMYKAINNVCRLICKSIGNSHPEVLPDLKKDGAEIYLTAVWDENRQEFAVSIHSKGNNWMDVAYGRNLAEVAETTIKNAMSW